MLAFGIASLVFSVVASFIPVFGIMISGLSGFLAWLSTGKGTPFGAAAIIINFINIPDLFTFFEYHKIYSTISALFPDKTKTPVMSESYPKQAEVFPPSASRQYAERVAPITKKQERPLIPLSNVQSDKYEGTQTNMIKGLQPISLSGKLFSWKDQDGKYCFSNTNLPPDNETLQVQIEINDYHKVTRISIINDKIYIPVTLWNNGRSATLNMVLDTGCRHTTVLYSYLNYISAHYGQNVTSDLLMEE